MTSYSAQQYRAAIEAGLKHRQREESLAHKLRQERALKLRYMAENERLRAENALMRQPMAQYDEEGEMFGVWTPIEVERFAALEATEVEAERLRAALDGHHAAWSTKWENCSICRALAGTEAKG